MSKPESFDSEVWASVRGAPHYLISNFGRVFYTEWNTWYAQWEICKFDEKGFVVPQEDDCGYLYVNITGQHWRIHRLVAEHFVEGYFVGCLIEFADGDKHNVQADNLVIFRNSNAVRQVMDVGTGKKYDSVRDAAKKLRLNASNITQCCQGKRKSCGGHSFVYLNGDDAGLVIAKRRIAAYRKLTRWNGRELTEKDLEWERNEYANRLYFDSQSECSKALGVSQSNISRALKHPEYSCNGWYFEWIE